MAYLPINLRNVIVHPSVVHPQQHVGIEVVVVLQAVGIASVGAALLVPVNAERRHAELHPRLRVAHCLVNLLYQHVHVVAPPVAPVGESPSVCRETQVVGKLLSRIRIRIEIVVHVDGINVVPAHDVAHDFADVSARFGQSGVEVKLSGILHEPFGMRIVRMLRREGGRSLRPCPIRVDPRMNLHVALVAFLHHELQRVPRGRRRFPLHSGQIPAPRLERRLVQGVGLSPHLKDNGIDARPLQVVELSRQSPFHLLRRHSLKLPVDALNPRAAKLTFRELPLSVCRANAEKKHRSGP